jgi:hypothetical protein
MVLQINFIVSYSCKPPVVSLIGKRVALCSTGVGYE